MIITNRKCIFFSSIDMTIKMFIVCQMKVLLEQSCPNQFPTHAHTASPLESSLQVPPFWHGFDAHGDTKM